MNRNMTAVEFRNPSGPPDKTGYWWRGGWGLQPEPVLVTEVCVDGCWWRSAHTRDQKFSAKFGRRTPLHLSSERNEVEGTWYGPVTPVKQSKFKD